MNTRRRYRSFASDSARWDAFRFRPGDIVISTPSKCGTTWMQMICALLVFQTPALDRPLSLLSPWLDMLTRPLDEVITDLEAQTHRRFVKTHTALDGLPVDERATYVTVGRHPLEVARSWDQHIENMDLAILSDLRAATVGHDEDDMIDPRPPRLEDPMERFWQWIEDDTNPADRFTTLRGMLHHLETFWASRHAANVELFHYRDLVADLPGEMRRLASSLGIEVSDAALTELAAAAGFEQMKRRASELAPNVTQALWRDVGNFFHEGPDGGRQPLLDDDDLRRYHERVAGLVKPELAAWVHGGWRSSGAIV